MPGDNVFSLMEYILELLRDLQVLFWLLALALFFWGLVKFIKNAADTKAHEEGKSLMIWGIIAFFVLVSLWGLVGLFLGDLFGVSVIAQPGFVDKDGSPI